METKKPAFVKVLKSWNIYRARKIVKVQPAHLASNSQVLFARGTSPLAQVFKLINNSWTPEWKLFTGVFECNNLSDLLIILISVICCFLNYAPGFLEVVESMFSIRGTGLPATSYFLNCILPNFRKANKIKKKTVSKQALCWFCKASECIFFFF